MAAGFHFRNKKAPRVQTREALCFLVGHAGFEPETKNQQN
jgi:hypothetical protein